MIKAIISVREHDQAAFPEVGMRNRLVITRPTVKGIRTVALKLAAGRPCRVEMYNEDRFYVPTAPITVFLNVKPPPEVTSSE